MKVLAISIFIFFHTIPLFAQDKQYSIIVAADGSGAFTSIQAAVNSIRDFTPLAPVKIFIKKGVYREKLVIPTWKTGIHLIGESRDSTVITNADYSGKPYPGNDWMGKDKFSTFNSYTVLLAGDDCHLENITIENSAGQVGQAVALHIEGDRCVVSNCRLLGNQDTLYAGKDGSCQYFTDCYIEGTTDFIFGASTVLFNNCTIHSKKDSYITAASTTKRQPYGFVFLHCKLTADSSATKVYLGRPWRAYGAVIFSECWMGAHILPKGWHNWDNAANEQTARYAEYKNTGPGAATTERVAWSQQLTAAAARKLTTTNILGGWDPLQH